MRLYNRLDEMVGERRNEENRERNRESSKWYNRLGKIVWNCGGVLIAVPGIVATATGFLGIVMGNTSDPKNSLVDGEAYYGFASGVAMLAGSMWLTYKAKKEGWDLEV